MPNQSAKPTPLAARLRDNEILIGDHFSVGLQRTLRLPDDGRDHPLPPDLGSFPIERVRDHRRRLPASLVKEGGFFAAIHPREALWLSFHAPYWRPCALKVGAGKINAISGAAWSPELSDDPDVQDYIVPPDQPWLDGFNSGEGCVRQFVAVPLGHGYTAEEQITGQAEFGGIQFRVFDPKPGRFVEPSPVDPETGGPWADITMHCCDSDPAMGLAAGGSMRQEIYPDSYGYDTWDPERVGATTVHLLDPETFRWVTGREAPPSPVTAEHYTRAGLPWFELEEYADVAPSKALSGLERVAQLDANNGVPPTADEVPLGVPSSQVVKLGGGTVRKA